MISEAESDRELTKCIRREVNILTEKWDQLTERSTIWRSRIEEILTVSGIHILFTSIDYE